MHIKGMSALGSGSHQLGRQERAKKKDSDEGSSRKCATRRALVLSRASTIDEQGVIGYKQKFDAVHGASVGCFNAVCFCVFLVRFDGRKKGGCVHWELL